MATPSSNPKFRPVLTLPQIKYIQQCIALDNSSATERMKTELSNYLELFLTKQVLGYVSPAYTSSAAPKQSMEQKLGMVSGEEYREQCYHKYSSSPELCTPQEIHEAKTYMYENDMMTAEEEAAFEDSMI